MKPDINWVETPFPGRIAFMPRPRGGELLEGEIRSYKDEGVDVLLSLLTRDEVIELDLQDEPKECKKVGIEYQSLPITDRGIPDLRSAGPVVRDLAARLKAGARIAVHCRIGIGRSATIAAAVLIEAGVAVDDALMKLSRARRMPVPETEEQVGWLRAFAQSTAKGQ